MTISKAIALRIKKYCRENHISYQALAKQSKIGKSTLYHIVKEQTKNTRVETLTKICNGMHINVQNFFEDSIFDEMQE